MLMFLASLCVAALALSMALMGCNGGSSAKPAGSDAGSAPKQATEKKESKKPADDRIDFTWFKAYAKGDDFVAILDAAEEDFRHIAIASAARPYVVALGCVSLEPCKVDTVVGGLFGLLLFGRLQGIPRVH